MNRALFAILILSTQAFSDNQDDFTALAAQGCTGLLSAFSEGFEPTFDATPENEGSDDFWKPSDFVIESSRPGLHGGKRDVLKKRAGLWFSFGGEFPTAPQGDPRWPILLFGEEGAKFLGFEILDDERMTIPDADELNGALEKINQHLEKKIRLRFYDLPKGKNFARFDHYVQKFHKERMLPIAGTLTSRLHDLSHHLGAIFIPEQILEQYDRRLDEFSLALDALKKLIIGDSKDPDLIAAAETTVMLSYFGPAGNIDGSTAIAAQYGKSVAAKGQITDEEIDELLSGALKSLSGQFVPEDELEILQERLLDPLLPNLDPRGPIQSVVLSAPAGFHYDKIYEQIVQMYLREIGSLAPAVSFPAPHIEDFKKAQAILMKKRAGLFAQDGSEFHLFMKKFVEERSQENPEYFNAQVLGQEEMCTAFRKNLSSIREAVNKAATQ